MNRSQHVLGVKIFRLRRQRGTYLPIIGVGGGKKHGPSCVFNCLTLWSKGPSVPTLGGSGTRCAASGYHSHTCSLYPSPLAVCSEGLRVGGSDGCGWVLCGVLVRVPLLGLAPLPGGRGAAPPPVGGGAPAALGGCTWWVVSRPAFAMPSIIALMGT